MPDEIVIQTISQQAEVTVNESSQAIITVNESNAEIVQVGIVGPQGPAGLDGVLNLAELQDLNISGKIDKSVLYYDAPSNKFKADANWTTTTLTDGGNF